MNRQTLIDQSPELPKLKAMKLLQEGHVKKRLFSGGVLSAVISDGKDYRQKIQLEGEEILSYSCTCHAETLCPHVLALLLQKDLPGKEAPLPKTPKASLKSSKSSLKEILEGAEKEELIAFILSLRSYYKDIPVIIRKSFISTTDEEHLQNTRDELLSAYSALKTRSPRESFVKYFNLLLLTHEDARQAVKERNYLRGVLLYLLLFEMVSLPHKGYDQLLFNAHYLKIYEEALIPLAEKKYTARESQLLFRELRRVCQNLKDLSEVTTLLRIMKSYITTETDFDHFYETLLLVYEEEGLLPHDRNNLLFLEYELLMMIGKAEEALELRRENPQVTDFRFMEAESLLGRGKLHEALLIVREGVERSGKNWDELIRWLSLEAGILKLLQDQESYIAASRRLLQLGEYKAYADLKRSISPHDWPGVYERLIMDEELQKNTKGIYKRILLEEKDKRRLLAFLEDNPELIVEHYAFLNPEYGQEAAKLLVDHIESRASHLTGRKDYEHIADLVEKLYVYGQEKLANELILTLVMRNKSKKLLHSALLQLKDRYAQSSTYIPE